MIEAEDFLAPARNAGFRFFTGVPCSFLTPFINAVIADEETQYVGAASEGEAVGIAAGAWLAGVKPIMMCQNSGLGNCVNPLTSMNHPFSIPTLMITTWRGQPGLSDEPQHDVMGRITHALLDTMDIAHAAFPTEKTDVEPALSAALDVIDGREMPYCFVMEKGTVRDEALELPPRSAGRGWSTVERTDDDATDLPTRYAVLEAFLEAVPDAAGVIATTGKAGRELFTLCDREQHLYQVGSMGCASAMGLGVALNTDRPVIVLDGDGAALMKLGSLATIGAESPRNLVHIVLDNGVHDSTGGQATASGTVDFASVAIACGYKRGISCASVAGFKTALTSALSAQGPVLLHVRIAPGSISKLGRPTVKPADVARRFRGFMIGDAA